MIKRRKPIRRVSKKRASAMVEYRRRRLAFLEKHPLCQVWLLETFDNCRPLQELEWMYKNQGGVGCPKATEIHHTKKPKATYLNDESTWLAVCREMHDKIESNKSWAREKGYLHNI
jgi:hypothetical protein